MDGSQEAPGPTSALAALVDDQPTRTFLPTLNINFTLFRVPIKVNASFFVAQTAVAVWIVIQLETSGRVQAIVLSLLVLFVFLSVLIHEMGHALEARRNGAEPTIALVWFRWPHQIHSDDVARPPGVDRAAGVVYEFVIAGTEWWAIERGWFDGMPAVVEPAARAFVTYNVFLGAIDLIPLGGMDGGAILQQLPALIGVPRPHAVLWVVYCAGGAAVGVWGFAHEQPAIGLLGLYLTYAGVRSQTRQVRFERDSASHPKVEIRVQQLLLAGRADEVAAIGREIFEDADSEEYQIFGASILTLGLRIGGDRTALAELLPRLENRGVDPAELAAGYEMPERPADALRVIESMALGEPTPTNLERLADVYIQSDRHNQASQLIVANPRTLRRPAPIDLHHKLA